MSQGNVELVRGIFEARGADSGEPVRQPIGVVYSDFRDGQIGEASFFRSWPEALAAAGLSG